MFLETAKSCGFKTGFYFNRMIFVIYGNSYKKNVTFKVINSWMQH